MTKKLLPPNSLAGELGGGIDEVECTTESILSLNVDQQLNVQPCFVTPCVKAEADQGEESKFVITNKEENYGKDVSCAGKAVVVESARLNKNDDYQNEKKVPPQYEVLLCIADKGSKIYRDPDGVGFADYIVNGHRETAPLRSRDFDQWLGHEYLKLTKNPPSPDLMKLAIDTLDGKAKYGNVERNVYVRVATYGEKVYLDLCDLAWRSVEIDVSGWRVVAEPPVRFRRYHGMRQLPVPVPGGTIDELRKVLNLGCESDLVLVVAWLLAAFRSRGPYPLLAVSGEPGSAKSTSSAIIRGLIDPNTTPLRNLPNSERDIFVMAKNSHLLVLDNLSGLKESQADILCRLATGAGFSTRKLYSDGEEVLFTLSRPIILNGIVEVATRSDLADRSVVLSLKSIPKGERRSEAEVLGAFDKARSRILGALLDGMVEGLRRKDTIKLKELPRMADFALWGAACETAYWPEGTFMAAYSANRAEAVRTIVEADHVSMAIIQLMESREEWSGTATDLKRELELLVRDGVQKLRGWPGNPSALSGRLNRAAPALATFGISFIFIREGSKRTRTVLITKTG